MKNMFSPNVGLIDGTTYEFPQSTYGIASKAPFNAIITRQPGSGKSELLTNTSNQMFIRMSSLGYTWVAFCQC